MPLPGAPNLVLAASDFRMRLKDSGYRSDVSIISSKIRSRTNSHESYEKFVQLRGAPDVLELINKYARVSHLWNLTDFSVSCLPASRSSPPGTVRASVISVGMVEVLVIFFNQRTASLANVRFYLEPDEDLSWSTGFVSDTHLDGGGQVLEFYGRDAISALADERLIQATARRLGNMRGRRKRHRRNGWHNPWLWNLAGQGKVSSPREPFSMIDVEEYTAEDVWGQQRRRTGQQKFRATLLQMYPNECAICGVDIVEVLEAAHLIPHSAEVNYRPENGRLLCANHHRAFDSGLYEWKSGEFTWTGTGPEPPLGGFKSLDSISREGLIQ